MNAVDSKGELTLDIALHLRYEALALCLVQHGASVDCADAEGKRLLHKAIHRRMLPLCQAREYLIIIFQNFLVIRGRICLQFSVETRGIADLGGTGYGSLSSPLAGRLELASDGRYRQTFIEQR